MRSWARISGHGFRPQFPAANEVNIVFSSLRSCDNSEVTPKLWSVDVTVTYLRGSFDIIKSSKPNLRCFYLHYAGTNMAYVEKLRSGLPKSEKTSSSH